VGRALTGRSAGVAAAPSMWLAHSGDDLTPRAPLPGDVETDVVIVGAGLTGLWTAYYLSAADPGLRIVVVERSFAGFGASGRNGGWCSALFPASSDKMARLPGSDPSKARDLHAAMMESVDEVGKVTAAEGIDAHFVKGGTIAVARTPVQLQRARDEVTHARAWGRGPDELALLDAARTTARFAARGALGATYTPDCARVQPGRLVRGLARVVERRGVTIHEQTTVTALRSGAVRTNRGVIRAPAVIRATEGYTPGIDGLRRAIVPVYSLIVATEPLSDQIWERVGLGAFETFTDYRHLLIYGQRTADGRIVFGGRGAPYHFGSGVRPSYDRDTRVFASLERALVDLLPVLRGVRITHRWGGPLGIARDWVASVGFDRRTGLGWAGGYVGDGVTTTNLAGRTLADLVTGTGSALTRLPWVGHSSRRWEPEPLRWLGVNAGLRAMTVADREERLTGRPSLTARVMGPLLGH
jgi:glycine/D-amino acid oxidase-like deaminating enzyme